MEDYKLQIKPAKHYIHHLLLKRELSNGLASKISANEDKDMFTKLVDWFGNEFCKDGNDSVE